MVNLKLLMLFGLISVTFALDSSNYWRFNNKVDRKHEANFFYQLAAAAPAQVGYGNPQPNPQPIPQTTRYIPPTQFIPPTQGPTQSPYGNGNGNNNGGNNGNPVTQQSGEPWQLYVRQAEQFTCQGKQDGFFPSRWCNVFYRCVSGTKYEFLCAVGPSGDRTWWFQHSTSSNSMQPIAQCVYPCDQERACTSPGGILKDSAPVSESQSEGQRIRAACPAKEQPQNYVVQPDNTNDIFRLPEMVNPCAGQADGTQLPSSYCNAFYVCFAGFRKDQRCAKGNNMPYDLFYNEQTRVCDWPCKVQCSKPIFGSSQTAQQVQAQDTSINVALCSAGNNNNNNNNNNYNMPTNPQPFPTNPQPFPTAPPTYPTNPQTFPTNPQTFPTNPQTPYPYGK